LGFHTTIPSVKRILDLYANKKPRSYINQSSCIKLHFVEVLGNGSHCAPVRRGFNLLARLGRSSVDNSGVELFRDTSLGIDSLFRLPWGEIPRGTSRTETYLAICDGSHDEVLPPEKYLWCHDPIAWAIVPTGDVAPCLLSDHDRRLCGSLKTMDGFGWSTHANIPRPGIG